MLTAAFWNTNVRDNSLELERKLAFTSSATQFATSATHTTFQDVGISASVSYAANRILQVTYLTAGVPAGGIQGIIWKLVRGSTDVRTFESTSGQYPNTSNIQHFTFVSTFQGPATAGTETFKIQVKANSANTNVVDFGAAAYPRVLLVEDLGPA